ncbi:hypothetical protein [uncultured Dysgonomonas sp.]|uniref:hypothetical protein n=1 Tax=uncultured Dysgonomonas sp. TaxID=206096 RepID=UPI00263485FE|nr:hypothetical protein [uncultured Dysgonomonas sp.]
MEGDIEKSEYGDGWTKKIIDNKSVHINEEFGLEVKELTMTDEEINKTFYSNKSN